MTRSGIHLSNGLIAAAGFACLVSLGCDVAETASPLANAPDPVSAEQGSVDGASADPLPRGEFVVFATCDTNGWIEPCGCASGQSGGLSRRASVIGRLAQSRPTLIVSCGGAARGASPYDREKLAAILRGEAAMGYDVHNIGATELTAGVYPDDESDLLMVSTNIRGLPDSVRKSVIVDVAGWRVLVLGVLSPKLAAASADVDVQPVKPAILGELRRLESDAGAAFDTVILLAYADRDELQSLAAELPEIDVVLGGHTGQSVAPVRLGSTLLTAVSNQGKFIARVTAQELTNRFPQKASPSWSADLHEVTADDPEDTLQVENLRQFRERLESLDFAADQTSFVSLSRHVGDGQPTFVGTAVCQSCHESDDTLWHDSAHSHAWQTLQDKGAHVDSDCQRCHTVGYGLPGGFTRRGDPVSIERLSVGCESCHGPSSQHVADVTVRTPWQASQTCVGCHDHENSPLFDYEPYWQKIMHGKTPPTKEPQP